MLAVLLPQSGAETACKSNTACTGIYDSGCDGSGDWFQCNSAAYDTSSSSCIYTKPPEYPAGCFFYNTNDLYFTQTRMKNRTYAGDEGERSVIARLANSIAPPTRTVPIEAVDNINKNRSYALRSWAA